MRFLRLVVLGLAIAALPWYYSDRDGQARVRTVVCPLATWLPSCPHVVSGAAVVKP